MVRKRKNQKRKKVKKNSNRWKINFNRQNKHPGITWKEDDDFWINFTITHSNNSSVSTTRLTKNPNKNDSRVAYIRNTPNKTKKSLKGKQLKNFKVFNKDKKNIYKLMNNKKR